MKILSRNQQDEIINLLQDILVKTSYVTRSNSTVFDIVTDSCEQIAKTVEDKSGVFAMRETLTRIRLKKDFEDMERRIGK